MEIAYPIGGAAHHVRDAARGAAEQPRAAGAEGTHGDGSEAALERAALRRKVQDLGADNALLTQNFMLLKARLTDVTSQRDAAIAAVRVMWWAAR